SPDEIWKDQCGSDVPKPLVPICERLYEYKDGKGKKDWKERPWVQRARDRVGFLIATVYDPEVTQSPLDFDRAIQSIQAAAEIMGYNLDRYWIPWRTAGQNNPDKAEQTDFHIDLENKRLVFQGESSNEPEEQPGVLLFRSESPSSSIEAG